MLKQCALDDPKLSYTGEPIVKWPERVSGNLTVPLILTAGNIFFDLAELQYLDYETLCQSLSTYVLLLILGYLTFPAGVVPAPSSSSARPIPSSLGAYPAQVPRSEAEELLHLCVAAQAGAV